MSKITIVWTSSVEGRFVAFVTGMTRPDEGVERVLREGTKGRNVVRAWSSEGYVVEGSDSKSGDTPESLHHRLQQAIGDGVELRGDASSLQPID